MFEEKAELGGLCVLEWRGLELGSQPGLGSCLGSANS